MLYVMLVGAYPFERPEDKHDNQKLQKMIQARGWTQVVAARRAPLLVSRVLVLPGREPTRGGGRAEDTEGRVRVPRARQGVARVPRPAVEDPGARPDEARHHPCDPAPPLVLEGLAAGRGGDEQLAAAAQRGRAGAHAPPICLGVWAKQGALRARSSQGCWRKEREPHGLLTFGGKAVTWKCAPRVA